MQGSFVLRIEDTDRERSTQVNVDAILEGLDWLGMRADEGPLFQTERFARYLEVANQWLEDGKAYHCYCTKEELDELRERQMAHGERVRYEGRCRVKGKPRKGVSPVVRFKNPLDGQVTVNDSVRGKVVFDNAQLDDLIIVRSDGSPTYNFTVVVDDADMEITHVIRGDDHLNNTPRQMNMIEALGATVPDYAHLPMILGVDGAKLSKRHGAVDIRDYRDRGVLPEALLNYLVRLGWSHGDQEIFSLQDMTQLFDVRDVNQSASSFNPDKLIWINQQHIIKTPAEELGPKLRPFLERAGLNPADGPDPVETARGFQQRAETLQQMAESARYCYEEFDEIDANAAKKHLRPVVLEPLTAVTSALQSTDLWNAPTIQRAIEQTAANFGLKLGKLGQPIRVAVTGGSVSPPIDVTLELVGRNRTVRRLESAIAYIEKRAIEAGNSV